MKLTNRFTKKQISIFVLLASFLLLLILYIGAALYFNNHFMFRTTINGIDSSGKTVAEVEAAIVAEMNGYELTIEQRDKKTEVLKGSRIKLKPEFDGTLVKELKSKSGFTWLSSLFRNNTITMETMVSYDEKLFEEELNSLDCLDKTKVKKPKDAYISKYSKKEGYRIVNESQGNTLNTKKFKALIKEAVTTLKESVSLEAQNCYLKPKYTAASPEIKDLAESMNRSIATEIIYEFGEKSEVLDASEIHKWLSVSEEHKAVIDEEKVGKYVEDMAARYNTAYRPKELKTSYGTTVTITAGDFGWRIKQSDEVAQLLEEIKAGKKVSREPNYSQRGTSFGENDYGDTYVEINLTAQHLFFYKNGSLLVESDFVSGNLSRGWGTPVGAYGITYTQREATLRGEDYATPVDYWMPFNGGVGLHDASWRDDFGGNYYKTSGSHGCVNLPPGVAKQIFENIAKGDPVLVYELPGTESSKAQNQDDANAVIAAINAIGDVTLENRAAVDHARAMYETLDEAGRSFVSNYDMLVQAETVLAQLQVEQEQVPASQGEQQPTAPQE